MQREDKVNSEGYADITAALAIAKIKSEERKKLLEKDRKALSALMNAVYALVDACGFTLEERIILKSKESGNVYR